MNNLFSIFDPSSFMWSLNWGVLALVVIFPCYFWASSSRSLLSLSLTGKFLNSEFKATSGQGTPGSSGLILVSLFFTVLFLNLAGLIPYVFTATSHPSITLSLALPFWLGFMSKNSRKNYSKVIAHLVPAGTPPILVPLMVVIELVSMYIRPLTLSVRLAANMVAGHLLLALVSGPMPSMGVPLFFLALLGLMVLTTLELAVSVIQAYVFSTLFSLYLAEASNPNN